jgi:serine/threonine protein kinase
VVYEGLDLTTKAIVALKVMSIKDGKASVPIKGVRREIEYAASVQHDNVVQLVDFVADEHTIVIVWELIQGSDLLDLLNEKGGRLEEAEAAGYFAQLLRGVTFIHAHGLCHRDLKPENCMVERGTGRLKIIDFGLSKHQQSAVTLGVGTPDYMAPELLGSATGGFLALQERRIGQYDARACDVWAMGVLLYLLVTGQYPFEDPRQPQNVVATLQNIAHGRMRPLPRRISPECIEIIAAMLTQDPAGRITLQGISQHPWLVRNAGGAVELGVSGPMAAAASAGPVATAPQQSRVESFSFPSPTAVVAKNTPVTPKVIAMNATGAVAGPAAAGSPTISAPYAVSNPNRDRVVPMMQPTIQEDGAGEEPRRSRLVPAFCRMWFGS